MHRKPLSPLLLALSNCVPAVIIPAWTDPPSLLIRIIKGPHPDHFLLSFFFSFSSSFTHPHPYPVQFSSFWSTLPPLKQTTLYFSSVSPTTNHFTKKSYIHNELRCPFRHPPVDSRRCPHCPLLLRHGPLCCHHPSPSRCCLQGKRKEHNLHSDLKKNLDNECQHIKAVPDPLKKDQCKWTSITHQSCTSLAIRPAGRLHPDPWCQDYGLWWHQGDRL